MDGLIQRQHTTAITLANAGEILLAYRAVNPRSERRGRGGVAPLAAPAPDCRPKTVPIAKRRRRTCKCGTCQACNDNARWERIFQEKFADPGYYAQPLRIRYASPLSQM